MAEQYQDDKVSNDPVTLDQIADDTPVAIAPAPSRAAANARRLPGGVLFWPILSLILILGFNAAFTENFCRVEMKNGRLYGSLVDIPKRATPVMLVGLGMTLVLATGGVDLSVGALIALAGSVVALRLGPDHGDSFVTAAAITLAVSLLAGLWNGLLVAGLNLQPIVATLILMVGGRGIAQLLTDGQNITIVNDPLHYMGIGSLFYLPFSITLVAIMFAITFLATRRTAVGLFVESVGNNSTASFYAGVNSKLVKLVVYMFSGFCSGLAGLWWAGDIMSANANTAGQYLELDAILAVVIGGTALSGGRFSLAGSMIGALIIQSLTTTILMRDIDEKWTLVVKSVVVLAVCLLQSDQARRKFSAMLRRARP